MTDMTAAQAAQQNNRDNGGKYATKEHPEVDGVNLDDSNIHMTQEEWSEKILASLTPEEKDEIISNLVGHAVNLSSKAEWSLDDNINAAEDVLANFARVAELPSEGGQCSACGAYLEYSYDDEELEECSRCALDLTSNE